MKRPDKPLYIPPFLRCEFNNDRGVNVKNSKIPLSYKDANRPMHVLRSQRRCTNLTPIPIRFDSSDSSSSSNTRNTSDKSYKQEKDYSDLKCCGVVSTGNSEIIKKTNENKSNKLGYSVGGGERLPKNDHGTEIENYETNNEALNEPLIRQGYSEIKYTAMNYESNEKKYDGGLFHDYGDSRISDIEAVAECCMEKGSVLTSSPHSHIVDEKVLEAAKCVPQGNNTVESEVLYPSDTLTRTNANRNNCDCDGKSYHDPQMSESLPKDYAKIFCNNYIPPPVPPPMYFPRFAPTPRLPYISTLWLSAPRPVPPRRLPHPRPLKHPSFQMHPSSTRYLLSSDSRHVSPSSKPPVTFKFLPPGMNFYIPPPKPPPERIAFPLSHHERVSPHAFQEKIVSPHAFEKKIVSPHASHKRVASPHSPQERIASPHSPQERIASPHSPQERIASPHSPQERIASPHSPQERIASPHSPQGRIASRHSPQERIVSSHLPHNMFNLPNLELDNEDESFCIPPPVPPSSQMTVANLQIFNRKQLKKDTQNRYLYTKSWVDKVTFDPIV